MTKQKKPRTKTRPIVTTDGQVANASYDTTGRLPEPSERRKASIAYSQERQARRRAPVALTAKADPRNPASMIVGSPHADQQGFSDQLTEAFGTHSPAFANNMLAGLMTAARSRGEAQPSEGALNAGLAFVDGLEPQNELEAAMAVNMFAANEAALDMLARARRTDNVEYLNTYVNAATKLQRTFVAQAEALAKLRRGGEQTVKVLHFDNRQQTIIGEQHNHGSDTMDASAPAPDAAIVSAIGHCPAEPIEILPVTTGKAIQDR